MPAQGGVVMGKEFKTRGELQALLLDEARKTGKCAELTAIVVTGPFPSREFTWDIMRQPRAALGSADCLKEIDAIVRRLQMSFELSGD
jgi:hypothetical protein